MKIEPTNVNTVSMPTEKAIPRTVSTVGNDSFKNSTKSTSEIQTSITTNTNNDSNIESLPEMKRKTKTELDMNEKDWIALIERANKAINGANKSFEYSIHEATKQIIVKVIDKDTNEVIREIPSEKILDMVAKMWELNGLFVDERR